MRNKLTAIAGVVAVLIPGVLVISCIGPTVPEHRASLVINEFMVHNSSGSGIVDAEGHAEDWVELYNAGDDSLMLNDYFITDSLDHPAKFNLPAVKLAPGSCFVVWGGKSDRDAEIHMGFSLSVNGDVIALFNRTLDLVDSVYCDTVDGTDKSGASCGRILDGGRIWAIQKEPSPGVPNRG